MFFFLCLLIIAATWFQCIITQQLIGMVIEDGKFSEGLPIINSNVSTVVRFFGLNLAVEGLRVALAMEDLQEGNRCDDEKDSNPYFLYNATEYSALATINHEVVEDTEFHFCLKSSNTSNYIFQLNERWLTVKLLSPPDTIKPLLPVYMQIILVSVLLVLSGIFSGLNLGLMSLDPTELKILMKSGTKSEQYYAASIFPVRRKGNFLLCTLLLGNVLVNNTMTILLSNLTSGTASVVISTAGIVVFGEIVPQALCSRYGLRVGAHTLWLTKLFMVLTFAVSYPLSKVLDLILGKEIGRVYSRGKLQEMLKVTEKYIDLAKNEVNIIQGALELSTKTVEGVMTPIRDCFTINIASTLDFETMSKIISTGFTRIPVYERENSNFVSILFVKDLAFVDPDDCMPLRTVCQYYQHPVHSVFHDTTLDKVLEDFKTGAYHMAIVKKKDEESANYDVIGIITLEDVIEEILKAEIVDETDVYTDNRRKKLNKSREKTPIDLSLFATPRHGRKVSITPQLLLAVHRFLRAEVEPFRKLTEKVLLLLLKQDSIISVSSAEAAAEKVYIYKKNKPADYFVLVVEGQVKVIIGRENLEFQGNPFSYYGVQSLSGDCETPTINLMSKASVPNVLYENIKRVYEAVKSPSELPVSPHAFVPDYDVIASSDVKYVKITRKQFCNAVNASKMSTQEKRPVRRSQFRHYPLYVAPNSDVYYDVTGIIDEEHDRKVMSQELMMRAAQYATVAGDRVRNRPGTSDLRKSHIDCLSRDRSRASTALDVIRCDSLSESDDLDVFSVVGDEDDK